MMSIIQQTSDDPVAIATIIAAVIAGSIAFLSTILTKEQKTSEFRQAWIDAIRADVSEFLGSIKTFGAMLWKTAQISGDAVAIAKLASSDNEIQKLAAAYYRIRLRLNPNKDEELLSMLQSAYALFSDEFSTGEGAAKISKTAIFFPVEVDRRVQDVLAKAHETMKAEWERVKEGEPPFIWTKRLSMFLLLAGLFVLIVRLVMLVNWPSAF
jgi:hypothetical protein